MARREIWTGDVRRVLYRRLVVTPMACRCFTIRVPGCVVVNNQPLSVLLLAKRFAVSKFE